MGTLTVFVVTFSRLHANHRASPGDYSGHKLEIRAHRAEQTYRGASLRTVLAITLASPRGQGREGRVKREVPSLPGSGS